MWMRLVKQKVSGDIQVPSNKKLVTPRGVTSSSSLIYLYL